MTIIVNKPGLLSTLQDSGRFGYQKYGVIVSGAMDPFAHTAANILVGNEGTEATLEMTVIGPSLTFTAPTVIAICGADLFPTVDGVSVPMWRPVFIREGTTLLFGSARSGCRSYLAVSGGFDVPVQMDSFSTYLRAGIGGFNGRALKVDDCLPIKPMTVLGEKIASFLHKLRNDKPILDAPWFVSNSIIPKYQANPVVRVIPGAQYKLFQESSLAELFSSGFQVQTQSDRMGYRLEGKPLQLLEKKELISEPVTFGTVQVPPDGNPIVLMADRQTTGGYPKIAQIISTDIPLVAQAQIGSTVRFQLVDLFEAQEVQLIAQYNIQYLKASVTMYVH